MVLILLALHVCAEPVHAQAGGGGAGVEWIRPKEVPARADALLRWLKAVRFEFAYDGGGFGKGGTGTLFVNDQKVAEGRIEHTQPVIFSADETADVGIDLGTPVVESIGSEARSRFTGRIPKVTIQVK